MLKSLNLKIMNIWIEIVELRYCAEKEHIYTANLHMLILCEKKSGSGWVGGWMYGWVNGW